MELVEFRQEFINEDVFAEAVNTNRYPEVVFIDHCVDILQAVQAKNEQKLVNNLSDEISIFAKGSAYWESMITRGTSQQVLNPVESQMLLNAVNYCNGLYSQLTKHQLKEITRIVALLKENGIE